MHVYQSGFLILRKQRYQPESSGSVSVLTLFGLYNMNCLLNGWISESEMCVFLGGLTHFGLYIPENYKRFSLLLSKMYFYKL